MFQDVTKSIKSSLYDRASSPLFGAFSISWCLWNYKLLLLVFSSLIVTKKIEYIESTLYSDDYSLILFGFIYPLITSVLFILLYPLPAKHVYKYWHSQQIQLKTIKQDIEDETPLTIEESREIRREIIILESNYETEVNRKNSENERLKELINDLENDLLNAKNKNTSPPPSKQSNKPINVKPKKVDTPKIVTEPVSDEQAEILKSISAAGGFMSNDFLYSELSFDKVKTQFLLEDLQTKGYVKYGYNSSHSDYGAELKTPGKKYAVDHGYVS